MNIPPFLAIGSLGTPEMILIGALVLLLFGAKKLPEFARGLGKSMGEFKKARNEFEQEIHRATIEEPQISRSTATIASAPAPVSHTEPAETKSAV
jgi:sec-independent protein translocase protein TatA